MHLQIVRVGIAASLAFSAAVFSATAAADEPSRPTSDFGRMPNGWAGYSLLQNEWAAKGRPPLAGGHDHGHHGHGHHGHGHHGHGHHGHGHHGHHGWWHGHRRSWYPIGGVCPVCFSRFCFNPYCGFYATSGVTFSVGAPAVVAPAPWVNRWQAGQLAQAAAQAVPAGAAKLDIPKRAEMPKRGGQVDPPQPAAEQETVAAEEIRRRVAGLRASNSAGRQRADRLIVVADRYFADGDYRRAASKYRQALAAAADYPAAHFRLGHTYVALGEFQPALEHFLMALELAGAIERPGFSLDELYGGDQVAEQTHMNRLFDAALREPDDGGLLMLVGLSLHYAEEPLRARGFFERAAGIAGAHQAPARLFLPDAAAVGD